MMEIGQWVTFKADPGDRSELTGCVARRMAQREAVGQVLALHGDYAWVDVRGAGPLTFMRKSLCALDGEGE